MKRLLFWERRMTDLESTYPRVSTILREMRLVKDYPEGVPAVEWGRARGSAVHLAIKFHEEGTLDEGTLHPDVRGPFQSYLRFKAESGYESHVEEATVVHSELRYRGTLDSRGIYKDDDAILDFKCSKHPDLQAAAYQLAAYARAWIHMELGRDAAICPRYVVQLGEESYRVHDVTSPEAVTIFEAAVQVWWAQREKLALPKAVRV